MPIFNQRIPLHAGPPKVGNVTFGRTRVQGNEIWQNISWSTVQLQNNELHTNYVIKQVRTPVASQEMATITTSKMNSSTLKLQVPTSNTTLTVWVAATLNTSSYRGDFSDPQTITYTSMFSDHHTGSAMALTLSVTHTHTPVLYYSPWLTRTLSSCQQNLPQHHIPVVCT